MDNATRILTTLDGHLDHAVRLIIYGRAALFLGFANPPTAVGNSKDVDCIIRQDSITEPQLTDAFLQMQPIELAELRDAFAKAKPIVLKLAQGISKT